MRCRRAGLDQEHLSPHAVRFPDFSVNRQKYSAPEDVLLPDYANWGIIKFTVADVPASVPAEVIASAEGADYTFAVVHDPLEQNYAHAEVRTSRNQIYRKNLKIKHQGVKRWFRVRISQATQLVRKPEL